MKTEQCVKLKGEKTGVLCYKKTASVAGTSHACGMKTSVAAAVFGGGRGIHFPTCQNCTCLRISGSC